MLTILSARGPAINPRLNQVSAWGMSSWEFLEVMGLGIEPAGADPHDRRLKTCFQILMGKMFKFSEYGYLIRSQKIENWVFNHHVTK